jgi:hypothetical protein
MAKVLLAATRPVAVSSSGLGLYSLYTQRMGLSVGRRLWQDTGPRAPDEPTKSEGDSSQFKSMKSETPTSGKNSLYNDEEPKYHLSPATWKHPGYKWDEMVDVPVSHHVPKNMGDKIARRSLRFVRTCFDYVTGYKHPPPGKENDPKYRMTPEKWLERIVFLESIAGVPGMVGGMVRHLQSLRLLRRDRAWIETLLEEAYNERMHLLTFIKLTKPGFMMRLMLLGAQGVFFNAFFLAYLVSPRMCHRFVGYLEEEAVVTYTRCIRDIEDGRLPEWKTMPAPDIAKQYWNMAPDATVRDLMYYVRADECKHREVNHTFGNLQQSTDRNPYALVVDSDKPHPTRDLKYHKTHPNGWERDEIAA